MHTTVFSALSTYGASEAENHLTESLVYVFRLLLRRVPEDGLRVLNSIVGPLPIHPLSDPMAHIRTQIVLDVGRPDVEVSDSAGTLVYIEVKHDAPLGDRQLERYLDMLAKSLYPNKRLVLLTRSKASAFETSLTADQFRHVCWYEIYDWLSTIGTNDAVSRYVVDEFLIFLEEKKMNIQRVSWEYAPGIASLLNLTDMIEVAAREAMPKVVLKRTAGWGWRGILLDGAIYMGVRLDRPLLVVFENNLGTNPTAKAALDLDITHFLSSPKDKQLEQLTNFVRAALLTVPRGTSAPVSAPDSLRLPAGEAVAPDGTQS